MKPKKYIYVDGCPFCTNGYNSVPCVICGGLGGRCSNPACVDGEVAVACGCNPLPYRSDEDKGSFFDGIGTTMTDWHENREGR